MLVRRLRILTIGILFLLIVGATAQKAPAGNSWKQVVVECTPQELDKIRARIGVAILDARPGLYLIAVDSAVDVREIEAIAGTGSVTAADNVEVKIPKGLTSRLHTSTPSATTSTSNSISATGGWTTYFGAPTPKAYADQPAGAKISLKQAQQFATGRRAVIAVIDTGIDPFHPLFKNVIVGGRNYIQLGTDAAEWRDPSVSQAMRDLMVDQTMRDLMVDQTMRDLMVDQTMRDLMVDQTMRDLMVDQTMRDLMVDQTMRDLMVDQTMRDLMVDGKVPPAFGHGTMTAGLVHYVAPNALIMPMKAFDAYGTSNVWNVVNAIRDSVEAGANVINMSFSGPDNSPVLEKTLNWAHSRGVVLVGSAGNLNSQAPTYPAFFEPVIATAALTINDQKASFSNYGRYVDMSALGVGLVTAFPGSHWAVVSGTSFSTTLVSGTAGLLNELGLNGSVARRRIETNADDLDTPDQYENKLGKGRVDALKAVRNSGNSGSTH